MLITQLNARKGYAYRLLATASINVVLQREGEVGFYLVKAGETTHLCRLAMSSHARRRAAFVVIGGLQGPPSAHKRAIIDATRELYGLRPKDAVLLAARAFAQAAEVTSVHAISDGNHVLRRLQYKAKFSHYDDYWMERGATRAEPFGFVFAPLARNQGPANKREAIKTQIIDATAEFVRRNQRAARSAADLGRPAVELAGPRWTLPSVRPRGPSEPRRLRQGRRRRRWSRHRP